MIKKMFKIWVNQKNDEGFTPIHFAAFKGNIAMIKLLQDLQADL